MSAQELVQLFKSIPEDTSNDASEKMVSAQPRPQAQPTRQWERTESHIH